jgi:SRSO17 transposase
MNLNDHGKVEARFAAYVDGLSSVIGHVRRTRQLRDYCTGLVLPGERKSVEPMAARTAPGRTAAQHQSLLHFVGLATWPDEDVLTKVREMVLPAIEKDGPIEAWIIDDTAFPKQGKHSVGVHHQYCGQLGKQANCQVAVSLSIANHAASLPVAYRLYLPQDWTKDRARRNKAGVPKQIKFKTKPEIALEQIRWACEAGLPRGVGLMDVAYGNDSRLREGMTELEVPYVAGILPNTLMWRPGTGPRRMDKPLNNTGRRDEPDLISAREAGLAHGDVARGLGRSAVLALCARARPCRIQQADPREAVAGVVADRVARERKRADQVLALDVAGGGQLPAARRFCKAALAHRARLSGAQARGRAWAL